MTTPRSPNTADAATNAPTPPGKPKGTVDVGGGSYTDWMKSMVKKQYPKADEAPNNIIAQTAILESGKASLRSDANQPRAYVEINRSAQGNLDQLSSVKTPVGRSVFDSLNTRYAPLAAEVQQSNNDLSNLQQTIKTFNGDSEKATSEIISKVADKQKPVAQGKAEIEESAKKLRAITDQYSRLKDKELGLGSRLKSINKEIEQNVTVMIGAHRVVKGAEPAPTAAPPEKPENV